MAAAGKMSKKYQQNKVHYQSAVNVGKHLYEVILSQHHVSDPQSSLQEKLDATAGLRQEFNKDELAALDQGVDITNINTLDLALLHKLVYTLCDIDNKWAPITPDNKRAVVVTDNKGAPITPDNKGAPLAPDLHNDLTTLQNNRNEIAHIADLTKYRDVFTWKKIEELRVLFKKILSGIRAVYKIDIDDKLKQVNDKLDRILKEIVVEVTDLTVGSFLKELQEVGACPFKVKLEIKETPEDVPGLLPLLQRIAKAEENTKVTLLVNKAYFDGIDLQGYDSEKYLTPLLDENCRCKLQWYRGNISNQMSYMLPATLKQLYIRMRSDQVEHLNIQLPKLPELWSLGLFLDLNVKGNYNEINTMDPSSLPLLEYKGKQLGLRFCACITTDYISWIVEIIKKLTKEHQCATLEFYQTRLNTGEDIESLLRALHAAEINVTTWIKLQNQENARDPEQEAYLNNLAKNLSLKMFKFLFPW